MSIPAMDPLTRIMRHVEKTETCWLWTGGKNRGGYGQTQPVRPGGGGRAHRVVYELLVGPIPDGLQLDHLCRVRACVNPEHLEPVTPQVNQDRGLNARRDACAKGHEMTPDNTGGRRDGRRYCKACHRARNARHAPVTHGDG